MMTKMFAMLDVNIKVKKKMIGDVKETKSRQSINDDELGNINVVLTLMKLVPSHGKVKMTLKLEREKEGNYLCLQLKTQVSSNFSLT